MTQSQLSNNDFTYLLEKIFINEKFAKKDIECFKTKPSQLLDYIDSNHKFKESNDYRYFISTNNLAGKYLNENKDAIDVMEIAINKSFANEIENEFLNPDGTLKLNSDGYLNYSDNLNDNNKKKIHYCERRILENPNCCSIIRKIIEQRKKLPKIIDPNGDDETHFPFDNIRIMDDAPTFWGDLAMNRSKEAIEIMKEYSYEYVLTNEKIKKIIEDKQSYLLKSKVEKETKYNNDVEILKLKQKIVIKSILQQIGKENQDEYVEEFYNEFNLYKEKKYNENPGATLKEMFSEFGKIKYNQEIIYEKLNDDLIIDETSKFTDLTLEELVDEICIDEYEIPIILNDEEIDIFINNFMQAFSDNYNRYISHKELFEMIDHDVYCCLSTYILRELNVRYGLSTNSFAIKWLEESRKIINYDALSVNPYSMGLIDRLKRKYPEEIEFYNSKFDVKNEDYIIYDNDETVNVSNKIDFEKFSLLAEFSELKKFIDEDIALNRDQRVQFKYLLGNVSAGDWVFEKQVYKKFGDTTPNTKISDPFYFDDHTPIEYVRLNGFIKDQIIIQLTKFETKKFEDSKENQNSDEQRTLNIPEFTDNKIFEYVSVNPHPYAVEFLMRNQHLISNDLIWKNKALFTYDLNSINNDDTITKLKNELQNKFDNPNAIKNKILKSEKDNILDIDIFE